MEGVAELSRAPERTAFSGLRVFLTGHTGFKGTWLSAWLLQMGSSVTGFSLPMNDDETCVMHRTSLASDIDSQVGDIRDSDRLQEAMLESKPDVVIHMAAQSLVRRSYQAPAETVATNVTGTANTLIAARRTDSVRAVVSIASDKCYENVEDGRPFRETDPLGGTDPYSGSKGAAEVVVNSLRRSLFDEDAPLLASVRAGNVLGAGDMSQDRLIPDVVRSITSGSVVRVRHPDAIRPWQHVLEPLRAYLLLAQELLAGNGRFATAWNVGPGPEAEITVGELVERFLDAWGSDSDVVLDPHPGPYESRVLRLDTTKAREQLDYAPELDIEETVRLVADGYRSNTHGQRLDDVLLSQIAEYEAHWTP